MEEQKALKLFKQIEKEKDNYYSSLIESFVAIKPSQLKNDIALLLSEISDEKFVPILINDIKKYLNGEDIGSLIYSLLGKNIGGYIVDVIDILCGLNPKEENFEALEMINLVLKEYTGKISKRDINTSTHLIKKTLKVIDEQEQKYDYLKWCLNWLQQKREIFDFVNKIERMQKPKRGRKNEISFSFRYKFENEAIFNKIIDILTKNEVEYSSNVSDRKIKRKYIIVIDDIDKNQFDPTLISNVNKELNLDIKDFDFFIGFTTWKQLGGFSIPCEISDFIRIIGGEIQVSIVTFTD